MEEYPTREQALAKLIVDVSYSKFPKLDHRLWSWFKDHRGELRACSTELLKATAELFAKELGYDGFLASYQFILSWKKIHDVVLRTANHTEKKSMEVLYNLAADFLVDNARILAYHGFTPPHVYNIDWCYESWQHVSNEAVVKSFKLTGVIESEPEKNHLFNHQPIYKFKL